MAKRTDKAVCQRKKLVAERKTEWMKVEERRVRKTEWMNEEVRKTEWMNEEISMEMNNGQTGLCQFLHQGQSLRPV